MSYKVKFVESFEDRFSLSKKNTEIIFKDADDKIQRLYTYSDLECVYIKTKDLSKLTVGVWAVSIQVEGTLLSSYYLEDQVLLIKSNIIKISEKHLFVEKINVTPTLFVEDEKLSFDVPIEDKALIGKNYEVFIKDIKHGTELYIYQGILNEGQNLVVSDWSTLTSLSLGKSGRFEFRLRILDEKLLEYNKYIEYDGKKIQKSLDSRYGDFKVELYARKQKDVRLYIDNLYKTTITNEISIEEIDFTNDSILLVESEFFSNVSVVVRSRRTFNELVLATLDTTSAKLVRYTDQLFDFFDHAIGLYDFYISYLDVHGKIVYQRIKSPAGFEDYLVNKDGHNYYYLFYNTSHLELSCRVVQKKESIFAYLEGIRNNELTIRRVDISKQEINKFVLKHRRTKIEIELPINQIAGLHSYLISLQDITKQVVYETGIYDLYAISKEKDGELKYIRVWAGTNLIEMSGNLFGKETSLYCKLYETADNEVSIHISAINAKINSISYDQKNLLGLTTTIDNIDQTVTKDFYLVIKNDRTLKKYVIHDAVSVVGDRFDILLRENELEKIDIESTLMDSFSLFLINKNVKIQLSENTFELFPPQRYKIYPNFEMTNLSSDLSFRFEKNNLSFRFVPKNKFYLEEVKDNRIILSSNLTNKEILNLSVYIYKSNALQKIGSLMDIGSNKYQIQFDNKEFNIFTNQNSQGLLLIGNEQRLFYLENEHEDLLKGQKIPIAIDDGSIELSLYQRAKKINLKLEYFVSKIDNSEKLKNILAKICSIPFKVFKRNEVWLVGENFGISHQDNGYFFFEKSLGNQDGVDPLFISRDNEMIKGKKVIKYDSFKHYFMYHLSNKLIFSHGMRDVLPSYFHNYQKNRKQGTLLQHGVVAMKRINYSPKSYAGNLANVVVSSSFEASIFKREMKFPDSSLANVGLVRYDNLIDESKTETQKIVFVMPTWRDWQVSSRDAFLQSEFFTNYDRLLRDDNLNQFLRVNNITLKFLPHIEMLTRFKDDFVAELSNIQLVDTKNESINELIRKSSLLVTDYSSVAFDFAYLTKPVVFFQFDTEDYLSNRGSYIDLYQNLFGPRCIEYEEFVDEIKKSVESSFYLEQIYKEKTIRYFSYRDKKNFQRNFQFVKGYDR